MYADAGHGRQDPSHLLSARLQVPLPVLALALEAAAAADEAACGTAPPPGPRATSPSAPSHPGRPASPSRDSGRPDSEQEHVSGAPNGYGAVSTTTNGSSVSHSSASHSSASESWGMDTNGGSSTSSSSAISVHVDGTPPPAAAEPRADPPPARAPREERRRTIADYQALLALLDGVAAHAIEAALEAMHGLTEPHVARILSQHLPAGGRAPPLMPPAASCLTWCMELYLVTNIRTDFIIIIKINNI